MMKKILVQGKGQQTLSDQDYMAKGGEGSVYGKGNTIYKIYHDSSRMIPLGKVDELRVLDRPNIFRPLDIILNPKKQQPIGFTMNRAEDGVFLCKLFSTGFWKANKITPKTVLSLVENIQETMSFIHNKHCLVVDLNELNLIATEKAGFTQAAFIDVDSYGTPSYPPTAIMASIRDYESTGFDENTDWFSLAILSCYMWLGIHPFKGGSHPKFEKNDPDLIEKRMKAHVSVFNSQVTTPRTMRDKSNIPTEYKKWFMDLFEKGKREHPPLAPGLLQVTAVKVTLIKSTGNFTITPIDHFIHDILKVKYFLGKQVVITTEAIHINGNNVGVSDNPTTDVIFTPDRLIPVSVQIVNGFLELRNLVSGDKIPGTTLKATDLLIDENTIFIKNGGKITEVVVKEIGKNRIISGVGKDWRVMTQSSKVFDGVIFEDVLGSANLIVVRDGICVRLSCPELDNVRVLDAKHDNGVIVVVGKVKNQYKKYVMRFDKHISHIRELDCHDFPTINFITLGPRTIMINDDGSLELFTKDPGVLQVQRVEDKNIDITMTLTKSESKALFFQDKRLYHITMRTK